MNGIRSISSDALVALSCAIDAAMDRRDLAEAIRLSSLQGAELSRWLEACGYPPLGEADNGESDQRKAQQLRAGHTHLLDDPAA